MATRGLQSRSTGLANMECHLPTRISHAVNTDSSSLAGVKFITPSHQRLPTFYNFPFGTPEHLVRSTNTLFIKCQVVHRTT
jgi:hypothetical protein